MIWLRGNIIVGLLWIAGHLIAAQERALFGKGGAHADPR